MVAFAICAYAVGFTPFTRLFGDGAITEQPSGILHNDGPTAQYPDLKTALLEYGYTYIVPTWVSERFTKVEVSVINEAMGQMILSAWYRNENGENLSVTVIMEMNHDNISKIETDLTTGMDGTFIIWCGK